jgi:glycosyltransferase involved in cell wall biosynthesis
MALRVAIVHSFYDSVRPSGENTQVQAEVQALDRAGVEVGLFGIHTDDAGGECFYRLRSAARVATGRGRSPLSALDAFSPDLVHVHNLFPNFGRRWVRRLKVPLVVTLHNFRFVCANGLLFRDGGPCTDCVARGPWPGLRHRCYRGSRAATLPLAVAQLGGPAADPVLARADSILCLSDRQREILVGAGIAPERLVDWSNFLPPPLDPGGDATVRSGRPREGCLYVGRLTPEKGAVDLAASWQGDHVLRVVGDGPQLGQLHRVAVGRPVEVVGPVPRPMVMDLMSRSAALALPGGLPDVSPLVYVEALACGLPVIARQVSDVAARVQRDRAGVVVDEVEEAPDAVTQLVADADLPRRCRAAYEARYTAEAWTERTLDLYGSLARGRRRQPTRSTSR